MAIRIPLSNITFFGRELEYAKDALDTGWISNAGKYVTLLEEALALKIQRTSVISVANGTVALELVLRALGIGEGDEVIVPALTFVAPAAVVHAVGARPVFADILWDNWTINPEEAAKYIGPHTKAVIAVDVLGHPCDYGTLEKLGIPIIEDAAEAHGALYFGKPVGSFGKVATFSFHANKTITMGEGGCVATDDEVLANAMRVIANHGMTKERPYWHEVIGHNFRMTNVTAAIGLGQVEAWDALVTSRNAVARRYDLLLHKRIYRRPAAPWATPACWLYTVHSEHRPTLLAALQKNGIDARAIWTALPDLPIYQDAVRGSYPVAREIANTAFWLPTWAHMSDDTIDDVTAVLNQAIEELL